MEQDLAECKRALAARATLEQRFETGAEDPAASTRMREKLQKLRFGHSTLDSVECREGICMVQVTNDATDDEQSDEFWLRQFQERRGEFFSQMRVRTRLQSPDSSMTELIFELPHGEDAAAALSSALIQIDETLAHGVAGCAHGRAAVDLHATHGIVESEIVGTECVRGVVDDAVRQVDVRGKSDAMVSQTFRW